MGHKVLVTGGAGYIGSVVVAELVRRGHAPVVLDDLSTGHREAVAPEVEFVAGHVGDRALVAGVLARHRIDAVVHCAALTLVAESGAEPAKYPANNVIAGGVLLEAAVQAGVKRGIFSSSSAISGPPARAPPPAHTPPPPINPSVQ